VRMAKYGDPGSRAVIRSATGVLPSAKEHPALDPQSNSPRAPLPPPGGGGCLSSRPEAEQGTGPEPSPCVLWGTDNIKTYGESLADPSGSSRAPVADSLAGVNKLEVALLA